LPGFELFRVPARWLAVAALGVALLAGMGWQRVAQVAALERASAGAGPARRALRPPLIAAALLLAALIVWGYAAGLLAASWLPARKRPLPRPPSGRCSAGSSRRRCWGCSCGPC
ncbi:MAG TPA: hypothetical protein PLH39_06725, partial [Promineifilum sp.]|nr:hypothetical protein [Promineifilum sp.]